MIECGRMEDYIVYLQKKFKEAEASGADELILTARDVYRVVSQKPTLPTCCMAMKRMMREGDETLTQPTTASGYGVNLTIRYVLKDRELRNVSNPPLKPGVKKGSHRKCSGKLRKPIDYLMRETLGQEGIEYHQEGRWIEAKTADGKWMILVEHHKEPFSMFLLELLMKADDREAKYTLLTEKKGYIRIWRKLPEHWRKQNRISLLYRGERDEIREVI